MCTFKKIFPFYCGAYIIIKESIDMKNKIFLLEKSVMKLALN